MKTLTIALCMLLIVAPAGAQQIEAPRDPNFYVPHGVRDVPADAMELESSSAETWVAAPGQRRNKPMPRPYPTRRGRYHRLPQRYGPRSQPQDSTEGAVIVGLVIGAIALVAAIAGDH